MNTAYPTTFNTASNAPHMLHSPIPAGFQPFPMTAQPLPQHYPMMMMHSPMQQQQQLPMQHHGFPMYPFPTHNYPMMAFRQPFFPINQLPVAPSPQPTQPQQGCVAPPSTPSTGRIAMHNTSLNASLLGGSTSFNDSVRYNPLGRGRSRDHSLHVDQTTSSSDRSFQQSHMDSRDIANNNDLIDYCVTELCRKQLTEQELVAKVSKSRRFKKFGVKNLPAAISIILTFPYFISTTVVLRTSPNDLQPVSKTIWRSEKQFKRSRGNKLNTGGEVLSVLGDIATLNLDENKAPTTVASMEKILGGIKV